jgi:lipoate-protein ligase A
LNGRFLDVTLNDPYSNLAAEEALFTACRTPTLRVWQNQRSVIIGRAQLARLETDLDYCEAMGIPIVRRFTAGGAVYNGPGNLNWTFVVPCSTDNTRMLFTNDATAVFASFGRLVVEALVACSVKCTLVSPNRIETAAGKISGMAAYISRRALICHGTILMSADLVEVERLSSPAPAKADRRYPRSRSTKVANAGVEGGLFVRELKRAAGLPESSTDSMSEEEASLTQALKRRYASKEWNFGDPFALDYV